MQSLTPTEPQRAAVELLTEDLQANNRATLLGVTGAGKSLGYDEDVFVVEEGERRISAISPMGPLVDRYMEEYRDLVVRVGDTDTLLLADCTQRLYTQSFDPDSGRERLYEISALTRHDAPEKMYRVKTSCGREAVMTGNHSLWVLRDGRLTLVETADIRESDYVPVPRSLSENGSDDLAYINLLEHFPVTAGPRTCMHAGPTIRQYMANGGRPAVIAGIGTRQAYSIAHRPVGNGLSLAMRKTLLRETDNLGGTRDLEQVHIGYGSSWRCPPLHLPMTDDLLRFIGLYVAEGCSRDSKRQGMSILNHDPVVRAWPEGVMERLGYEYLINEHTDYTISSSTLTNMFGSWCGSRALNKRLPKYWPELSNRQLGLMLQAYWDGDGGVEGQRAVTTTSASKQLASDLTYALMRFGIHARINRKFKRATNSDHQGAWYYGVSITGQQNLQRFADAIGFSIPYKQEALLGSLGKKANSNVDLVPLNGADLRWLRSSAGLTMKATARRSSISRLCVSLIESGHRRPQRETLRAILQTLKTAAVEPDEQWTSEWNRLWGLTEVAWAPIVEATLVQYDHSHVYDFTVPGAETFLGGHGGFYVHNTAVAGATIEAMGLPTVIIAHNKTLAAQLYHEMKTLFPDNAVEYFVSYYDYYQPEAYVPSKDLYIEKDAQINEQIERLRHSATGALLSRKDVIVVASVSALYGLGNPAAYGEAASVVEVGQTLSRDDFVTELVSRQYTRNDLVIEPSGIRVRGDRVDVFPPGQANALSLEWWGDEVESIRTLDTTTGERGAPIERVVIFPATHYAVDSDIEDRLAIIEGQRDAQILKFSEEERFIEAQRIKERVNYDLENLREFGWCSGVENYAAVLEGRPSGARPWCLFDYFPDDFLVVVDESHQTLPQIGGMSRGDRARKDTLIDWGFRLPCALDNRPQTWEEFLSITPRLLCVSATPAQWEREQADPVELLVRPTGIVDPPVETVPTEGQIKRLRTEIEAEKAAGRRTLVTTLTKAMAERLSEHLEEWGVPAAYLHSDILTLERLETIRKLRTGEIDVIVGVNLLREGLDLPEVGLVAIMDADREGFLRGETALIQTMGRAARNPEGRVMLFADKTSGAMERAIEETERRRKLQMVYNEATGQVPKPIIKSVDIAPVLIADKRPDEEQTAGRQARAGAKVPVAPEIGLDNVEALERAMLEAAQELRFEEAAQLRDRLNQLTGR